MKLILVIFLGGLLISMLFLLERTSRYRIHLDSDQGLLFVALAILAAACLVGLSTHISSNDDEISRAYCKIASELSSGPRTRQELGAKIGSRHIEEWEQSANSSSSNQSAPMHGFSSRQTALLERLIYEGKIVVRNDVLSLPS